MFRREFSDHQMAAYLKRKGVEVGWRTIQRPPINEYWNEDELVAIIVFDNTSMRRVIYTHDEE